MFYRMSLTEGKGKCWFVFSFLFFAATYLILIVFVCVCVAGWVVVVVTFFPSLLGRLVALLLYCCVCEGILVCRLRGKVKKKKQILFLTNRAGSRRVFCADMKERNSVCLFMSPALN